VGGQLSTFPWVHRDFRVDARHLDQDKDCLVAFSLAHDVRIDGHLIRLRCAGTGRPLLLLHDLGGSGASFAGITSAIVAQDREAVAPDLPGCAQSDPVPGGVEEMIDHLDRLVENEMTDEIDVFGKGFGGYLALSLAATRPSRYRRVVVEDPICPPPAGARSSSRMSAGMALSGALTTVRRGRLLQNVGGFTRAKEVLQELASPNPNWWSNLSQVSAECLLLDTGSARPDDRNRFSLLQETIPRLALRPVSTGKESATAVEHALLEFVA
jgi:esterase